MGARFGDPALAEMSHSRISCRRACPRSKKHDLDKEGEAMANFIFRVPRCLRLPSVQHEKLSTLISKQLRLHHRISRKPRRSQAAIPSFDWKAPERGNRKITAPLTADDDFLLGIQPSLRRCHRPLMES